MKQDEILTLHPDGEVGTLLSLQLYTMIKDAIVEIFLNQATATLDEIISQSEKKLSIKTEEPVHALIPIVCLDLEARDYLERLPDSKPLQFRMKLMRC